MCDSMWWIVCRSIEDVISILPEREYQPWYDCSNPFVAPHLTGCGNSPEVVSIVLSSAEVSAISRSRVGAGSRVKSLTRRGTKATEETEAAVIANTN
jgi:hypothetical protein